MITFFFTVLCFVHLTFWPRLGLREDSVFQSSVLEALLTFLERNVCCVCVYLFEAPHVINERVRNQGVIMAHPLSCVCIFWMIINHNFFPDRQPGGSNHLFSSQASR